MLEVVDALSSEPSSLLSSSLLSFMAEEAEHDEDAAPAPRVADESRRGRRLCYTRVELESLRPPDSVLQLWWRSVYQSLDPAVVQEYEGLCVSTIPTWSDGRKQSSLRKKNKDKKKKEDSLSCIPVKPMEDGGKRTNELDQCPAFKCDNFTDECDSIVTEESLNEEEDTDDDYSSIQRPAFLVEGEPNFESGPPADGLEYLRRVRWEATQLPHVKVVKFDMSKCKEQTPYMPNIPGIAKCRQSLLPMTDWVNTFLVDFTNLRQVLMQFPFLTLMSNLPLQRLQCNLQLVILSLPLLWQQPVYSETAAAPQRRTHHMGFSEMESSRGVQLYHTPVTKNSNAASGASHLNHLPTMSTLLALNPVSRAAMLQKRVMDLENEGNLSWNNCLWIFALCVAVDAPLDAEMGATMRSLLRKCSCLLASRSDPADDAVAMLNVLTVISGNHFGQSEEHSQ